MSDAPHRIDFHRTKYGPEILIDIAWIHEMPTFIHTTPHWLSFYDVTVITAGRGWFWLDGHRYRVAAGQLLFTSPGQVRRWDVSALDGICLFFPVTFLAEFFSDAAFLERLPYFHDPGRASAGISAAQRRSLERSWGAMRNELRTWRDDSAHLLRAGLYEQLVHLGRLYGRANDTNAARIPHRQVTAFRRLVDEHATTAHGLRAYTRSLGISAAHLTRLCRQHLGSTAKQVIEARLEVLARRELLYSDRSAAQVAASLGFKDPSYFARFFKRRVGVSPAKFRAIGG